MWSTAGIFFYFLAERMRARKNEEDGHSSLGNAVPNHPGLLFFSKKKNLLTLLESSLELIYSTKKNLLLSPESYHFSAYELLKRRARTHGI